jgi:phosphate starvation-inducible PhoH-like protein
MGKKSRAEAIASMNDRHSRNARLNGGTTLNSKWAHEHERKPLLPQNENQNAYLIALRHSTQTVVTGPAGTGKTYMAATHAADEMLAGRVKRIVLIRPNVSSGQKLGFDPGTEEEKLEKWLRPLLDDLSQRLSAPVFETARRNGKIQLYSVEKMRGATFDDAFIIVDEAQNLTVHEIKMVLTRIGKGSRIVINGDIDQSDLKVESGLYAALKLIDRFEMDVSQIRFSIDDVVRSGPCAEWVKAFYHAGL